MQCTSAFGFALRASARARSDPGSRLQQRVQVAARHHVARECSNCREAHHSFSALRRVRGSSLPRFPLSGPSIQMTARAKLMLPVGLLIMLLHACGLCLAMTKAPLKVDKYVKTCGWAGAKDPKHPTYHPPQVLVVDCGHGIIGEVVFASWGDPEGECSGMLGTDDSFRTGSCDSKKTTDVVEKLCVGQHKCELPGDVTSANGMFGVPTPDCGASPKKIAVVISCGAGHWGLVFLIVVLVMAVVYLIGGVIYGLQFEGKTWGANRCAPGQITPSQA